MWPFNRHKHNWKVFKIIKGEYTFFRGLASQLYYRCSECKAVKSRTVDGWWDLSDFE